MRRLFLTIAAVAVALPLPAHAEECPEKVDSKTERAFGDIRGWLEDDRPVYQPAKLVKLGQSVSYVIVDRVLTWDGARYEVAGIERLRFRLAGITGNSDTRFPSSVRKAFDKAYPGAQCDGGGDLVCEAGLSGDEKPGRLGAAELSEGNLYFGDDAYGPALPLLEADDDLTDSSPAFLVCDYKVET